MSYSSIYTNHSLFYRPPKKAHAFPIDGAIAPRMEEDAMNYQYYDFESKCWCQRMTLKSPYYTTNMPGRSYLYAWSLLKRGGL